MAGDLGESLGRGACSELDAVRKWGDSMTECLNKSDRSIANASFCELNAHSFRKWPGLNNEERERKL